MKFKLFAGLIVLFCCLYYIEAKPKRYNDRHCLASVYNLQQQLAFCHGRFVCDYYHGLPFQCIEKDSICDGTLDCPGGEDEYNCPKKVTKCELHQLKCPTSDKCAIPCNSVPECDYGIDELNCVPTCKEDEVICKEGTCAHICDGKRQCKNGIDETNCQKKECGAFPAIQMGTFSLLDIVNSLKDARALLSCPEGYKVDGKPGIECLENMGKLSWSTDHGYCVLKVCDALPKNVENGKFKSVSGSGVVGDSAVLVCNLRYSLYPETLDFVSITCQLDGKWSTPGEGRCLQTQNLAFNQPTTQSSVRRSNNDGTNAVDGIRTTGFKNTAKPTCFHSGDNVQQPWWEVSFGQEHPIAKVEITIRLENNVNEFKDISVFVKKTGMPDKICGEFEGPADSSQSQITITCGSVLIGDAVRIQKTSMETRLVLCEVEVYTFLF